MSVRGFGRNRAVWLGACLLLALSAVVRAQVAPPPILNSAQKKCKANSKDPACKPAVDAPAAAAPSAASDNPFPAEESKHGGDAEGVLPAAPAPGKANATGLPAMPTGNDADPPEESNRSRRMPKEGYTTGDEPSSSGSGDVPAGGGGTSSSRSNSDDDVAPTTAAPDAPVKASKLKDLGSSGSFSEAHAKLEKTRFDDDLKVGKFYLQDGNPQGAYLRYKDALNQAPDDPDALFGLAEAANKLNKRDEAVLNYRETLKADPGGDHDRDARAALKRLGASLQ